jgi:hypothetical protein
VGRRGLGSERRGLGNKEEREELEIINTVIRIL